MTTTADSKNPVRRSTAASPLPTTPRSAARCARARTETASIAVLIGMLGLMGCAPSIGASAGGSLGVTMAQAEGPAVHAGVARVVGSHVSPLSPVQLTSDGRSIAVRFAHPRAAGALVNLDSESLMALSPEQRIPAEPAAAPTNRAVRVVLRGGRFIVCWKRGSREWGYRLMAQAWTARGSPLGSPVPISPPDIDVFGAPQLVSVDGEHAVATFIASSDQGFQLMAVPLRAP